MWSLPAIFRMYPVYSTSCPPPTHITREWHTYTRTHTTRITRGWHTYTTRTSRTTHTTRITRGWHTYTHASKHANMQTHTHTRIFACTHAHTHTRKHTRTHAYMHAHTHIRKHTRAHANTRKPERTQIVNKQTNTCECVGCSYPWASDQESQSCQGIVAHFCSFRICRLISPPEAPRNSRQNKSSSRGGAKKLRTMRMLKPERKKSV